MLIIYSELVVCFFSEIKFKTLLFDLTVKKKKKTRSSFAQQNLTIS